MFLRLLLRHFILDESNWHNKRSVVILASKFKLLHDLSITLKVPTQDLLRYSSDEICGKITYFLILCGDTLQVLDYYVTFEFYLAYILPRSWYFLLST